MFVDNIAKWSELVNLQEVISDCGGVGICAESETDGSGWNAPVATSQNKIVTNRFSYWVYFGYIPCNCFRHLSVTK